VSFVDYQVGRLLDALEDSKQAHRTVVALISDHGYKLGEFGMWGQWKTPKHYLRLLNLLTPFSRKASSFLFVSPGKHSTLHTDLHVPFVMRHPHMTQRGRQSHVIVELIDLYPTLAELAGIWPKKEGENVAY
jgi:iduronate 2-sulfatase